MPSATIPDWPTEFREVAKDTYAYVQADGGWNLSDAGLIVGDETCVVVDALNTIATAQQFRSAIERTTPKRIQHLISTHHHGDHTNGNQLFTEASIIAHYKCREEMERMPPPVVRPEAVNTPLDNTGVVKTLPNLLIQAQTLIYQGQRRIEIIPCEPAHTTNDVLVYVPDEGVLFAGDVVFFYSTPMCGGGNFHHWMDVIDDIARMDVETIVPGHGPVGGRTELAEMREYMRMLHFEARKRFDAGLSRAEATRDIDLGQFSRWKAPERIFMNVGHLWSEFTKEPFDMAARDEMLAMRAELEGRGAIKPRVATDRD
jgi:glyoxylase-like metal-dependent hydrolase (beta-lactamase superfamily II)